MQLLLQGDLNGAVNGALGLLNPIFPNATTADYCDLIAWMMASGLPSDLGALQNGQMPGDLVPWLSEIFLIRNRIMVVRERMSATIIFSIISLINAGIVVHRSLPEPLSGILVTILRPSIRFIRVIIWLFFQYGQRFGDRLSVSAGVRAEYYRINNHYREAETKIFGTKVPFRPVLRAGLNCQLADYSFLCASFGQGYRNPSVVEKYLRKDIGGVGVYPNENIRAEKGFNAELGFKQGYKLGNLQGMLDVAGFYTEYKDMIEFQFGLFNNGNNKMINSISDAVEMLLGQGGFGIGAQFHNVSKARIYGMEVSTNGVYNFNKNTKLYYNLGYVYTEPRDADYKERNALEDTYTDPLQMKEKSNNSKYLKYRQKHTFKTTLDFEWKRINLGMNVAWRSKTLAVDYIMLDERENRMAIRK